MKPNAIEFGGYLKMIRKRANLTVRQLEDKSGVSHSYLTQIENGRRGVPSPDILKKLANPLNITYEEIFLKAGYFYFDYNDSEEKNQPVHVMNRYSNISSQDIVSEIIQIPIYGEIKAGYDYVAEQNIIGYKVASKSEVSDGEYFYLIVKGDSMIEEGIHEGYHVLVKKQSHVANGKIGVVIVNGDEATLKRVYYDGDNIVLQAANRNIPPRILPIDQVFIQGQVKSVVFDV